MITFRFSHWTCVLYWSLTATSVRVALAQQFRPQPAVAPVRNISSPGQLIRPTDLAFVDGMLVVLDDRAADGALAIFNTVDGRLLRHVGAHGAARGAFVGPLSVEPDAKYANRVWVHDAAQSQIVGLRVSQRATNVSALVERRRLPTSFLVFSPVPIDSRNTLATGFLPNSRLAMIDGDGRVTSTMVNVPGLPGEPVSVRQEAYRSRIAVHVESGRVAVATRHADRLELFTLDGRLVASAPRPHRFEPRYSVAEGRSGPIMSTGPDLRFGYIDLAGSARRIYALYSGVTRKGGKGMAPLGREIRVSDWDGRAIGSYLLPRPALAITADPRGGEIFVLHPEPNPVIAVYRLPKTMSDTVLVRQNHRGGTRRVLVAGQFTWTRALLWRRKAP